MVALANLRDALSDITDRLCDVEVHAQERSRTKVRVLATSTPTHPVTAGTVRRRPGPKPGQGSNQGKVLPLRQWRTERGWTQTALAVRLRGVVTAQGLRLPDPPVVKTMISRWERGHRVGEFYQHMLALVFDQAPASDVAA
jgi:hypothetical protein